MNNKIKTIIVAALVAVMITTSLPNVFASHEDEGIGQNLWSRTTSDGHRGELTCQSSPNADKCKVPYYIDSSLTNIGGSLTLSQISSEASTASTTVSHNEYMGVISSSNQDNRVSGATLSSGQTAGYEFEKHCTGSFLGWCYNGYDSHNVDFDIEINTNTAYTWSTSETCSGSPAIPSVWDISKTFGHEFYHLMSIEHSSTTNSITFSGGYVCNVGHTPNTHDIAAINNKYPSGVV